MTTALKAIRALTCIGALFVLFTPRRNRLLLGLAWFLTAVAPALLLADHFLPSYLVAPLAGMAIAWGTILDWTYEQCARLAPAASAVGVAILLVGWGWIHVSGVSWLAVHDGLLGESARHSEQALNDVRSLYPTLPKGTILILFNEEVGEVAGWEQADGGLFRMAYQDPSLRVLYAADSYSLSPEDQGAGRILAFKWSDSRLTDVTTLTRQRPDLLMPHAGGAHYYLELPSVGVEAGNSYTLRIPQLQNQTAELLHALDGKVQQPVKARLDERGEAKIGIDAGAAAGTYTLVAVRREGEPAWIVVNRSVR